MKICKENNKIIIYLQNKILKKVDFDNKELLEEYFEELFFKLKRILNLKLKGFYIVHVYIDKIYGAVIELKKEEFDYEYDEVDMQLIIEKSCFLYKINDYFFLNDDIKKHINMYLYNKKLYITFNDDILEKDIIKMIENIEIIYNSKDILLVAKKINQNH